MGTIRSALVRAPRARNMRAPSTRPPQDWDRPVDGRAPRLGTREYIGHDIRGRGAWADRDPLLTPKWWSQARFGAVAGWAALTAGAGYLSWRRHGGKAFILGRDDDA